MVGGVNMSLDAFRKTSARESEFKGQCGDTDKYFRKSSWKTTAVAWIILGGICVVAYFIFF